MDSDMRETDRLGVPAGGTLAGRFFFLALASALGVLLCVGPAMGDVTVLLDLGGGTVGPGELLTLSGELRTGSGPVQGDLYLVLFLPGGTPLFLTLTGGGVIPVPGNGSDPATWTPLLEGVVLPGDFETCSGSGR